MGLVTVGSVAVVVGASTVYWLRRRISRKWINLRSQEFDLSGKVIVITGGNVGLGYEVVKDLSNRNARVIMGCRNLQQGQEAIESIQAATGNNAIECLELDLASIASVRDFCSVLKSKFPPIDALVLNAGVWVPMEQEKKTHDGFEIHFGVNHLAHFEMARLLQSHMAESNSRIVFVASTLAKSGQIDFETEDFVKDGRVPAEGTKSFAPTGYCDSKLMNLLTCRQLATQLPSHITTYAVCPGFCRTSLARNVSFPLHKKLMFAPVMLLIQRTAVQGAQNIVFATVEDTSKLENGGFYRDGEIGEEVCEHVDSLGSDATEKLWNLCDKLLTEM